MLKRLPNLGLTYLRNKINHGRDCGLNPVLDSLRPNAVDFPVQLRKPYNYYYQ